MNLNKAFLIGRLTRDPESRTLPNGQPVSNFGLATNRVWTNQSNEKQEQTEFHNIVAFGKLAEICNKYLTKGGLVLVEGRLQTRSWQDQSGGTKYRTEIIAEKLQMGPKAGGGQRQSSSSKPREEAEAPVEEIDEIQLEETPADEVKAEDIPF